MFGVNTDGSDFTNLYNFTAQVSSINGDGANPIAGLVLSGHTLYGTAENGGGANDGTVFALTLPVPLLKIAAASHQVVISWPAWASGYEFQAAANLSSGSWSNIINGIGTVGTNCVFTNTLSNQAAYFRLQHQ